MSEKEGRRTRSIGITGMTCATCAETIERAVGSLEGVASANVNLASEKATFTFDPEKVDISDIEKAIKDSGYGLVSNEVNVKVKGMTCAACVRAVESSLERLDGVISASANLATDSIRVRFEPGLVNISAIKQAISDAGYEPLEAVDLDTERAEREREMYRQRNLLLFALAFGIPTLVLSMLFGMTDVTFGLEKGAQHWVLFLLATPVQVVAGSQFYIGTYKALRNRSANMDTLIAMGTSAAYLASVAVVFLPDLVAFEDVYFDSSAMIISLILLGKYLEARAKGRTSEAIRKLMDLQPKQATVIRDGEEVRIPAENVMVDDVLIIRPGEQVPTDSMVIEGHSSTDESMITGESIPVEKDVGGELIGGTLNQNGLLRARATRVGRDTALAQIVRLVEEAQGSKAPIQRLADRVAAYFVPTVITIAIVSFLVWYLYGYYQFDIDQDVFVFSLSIFITVLVIACPCALGLATPTAIMVGTGKGAENGILIKSGASLEQAGRIEVVAFDKTGTLTKGRPEVTDIRPMEGSREHLLLLAAIAEKGSEHPLADAIMRKASEEGLEVPGAARFLNIPGKGVSVEHEGSELLLGNRKLMEQYALDLEGVEGDLADLERQGRTVIVIARDGVLIGLIAVADTLKESSPRTVRELKRMGIEPVLITGDNRRTAEVIGKELGIERVIAEVLPEDKASMVRELQQGGRKVAMVGDGVNDAPALAVADVGIAIGSGTDVAVETGDIVLIKDDITDVVAAIQLSRRTIAKIRQNLFWAFAYNSAGIPIAAGILYPFFGVLLSPIIAAGAMAMSSVSVVSNAALLKRYTPEVKMESEVEA